MDLVNANLETSQDLSMSNITSDVYDLGQKSVQEMYSQSSNMMNGDRKPLRAGLPDQYQYHDEQ